MHGWYLYLSVHLQGTCLRVAGLCLRQCRPNACLTGRRCWSIHPFVCGLDFCGRPTADSLKAARLSSYASIASASALPSPCGFCWSTTSSCSSFFLFFLSFQIDAFLSKQLAAQFGVDAAEEEDDEDADLHALDEDDDIEEEGEEEEEEEEGGDGEREEEWGDDLSSGDEDLEDFADDENEEDEEDDEEEEEEVDDRDSSGGKDKPRKTLFHPLCAV